MIVLRMSVILLRTNLVAPVRTSCKRLPSAQHSDWVGAASWSGVRGRGMSLQAYGPSTTGTFSPPCLSCDPEQGIWPTTGIAGPGRLAFHRGLVAELYCFCLGLGFFFFFFVLPLSALFFSSDRPC